MASGTAYDSSRDGKYNMGFPYINNSMGIWVYATANATMMGSAKDRGETHIYLDMGWNLVGYPSDNPTRTVAEALSGIPYDYIQTDNERGGIITLTETDMMKPGKGYWIHVTSSCLWTVRW